MSEGGSQEAENQQPVSTVAPAAGSQPHTHPLTHSHSRTHSRIHSFTAHTTNHTLSSVFKLPVKAIVYPLRIIYNGTLYDEMFSLVPPFIHALISLPVTHTQSLTQSLSQSVAHSLSHSPSHSRGGGRWVGGRVEYSLFSCADFELGNAVCVGGVVKAHFSNTDFAVMLLSSLATN